VEFDEPELLEKYGIIYISGADTILKNIVSRNALFIGVSAVAMILEGDIKVVDYFTPAMNSVGLVDRTALRVKETTVFPHDDREDLFTGRAGKAIEEGLQVFERMNQCRVTRLRDNHSILIT
jgi:dipeptidase E